MPNYLETPDDLATAPLERYQITLTFELAEPVTPDYFADRVAAACFAYGALRPNEEILLPSDPRLRIMLSGERVYPQEKRG